MKTLTPTEQDTLISTLQARFMKHKHRHPSVSWDDVESKLRKNPEKLASLAMMEETGGEVDVVSETNGDYAFYDCSPESPTGRRSLCYDRAALDARKENKPKSSVEDMAREMGVELMTESEYRHLQTIGSYDLKTSSWIATPEHIRKLGGALFCDRRFDTVFTYHNGAESYYAGRGWRGVVKI